MVVDKYELDAVFFLREHTRAVFTKVNSKDDLRKWILINHVTAKKAMTIPPQEPRPPSGIPGASPPYSAVASGLKIIEANVFFFFNHFSRIKKTLQGL